MATENEPFTARLHFITRPLGRLNRARIKLAPGYYTRSTGWVVLTTIGRRSGLPRQTLLPCGRRNGEVVVVSTYGWRSDWIRNLAKNPRVTVTRDGAEVEGLAQVIEDVRRKRWIMTENPLVIPPFLPRAMVLGPLRSMVTALLRHWVTSRPVVVIRT